LVVWHPFIWVHIHHGCLDGRDALASSCDRCPSGLRVFPVPGAVVAISGGASQALLLLRNRAFVVVEVLVVAAAIKPVLGSFGSFDSPRRRMQAALLLLLLVVLRVVLAVLVMSVLAVLFVRMTMAVAVCTRVVGQSLLRLLTRRVSLVRVVRMARLLAGLLMMIRSGLLVGFGKVFIVKASTNKNHLRV